MCRMVCQVFDYCARQRDPKLANWFVGVLLPCVIHADTLLSRDERRRQIPAEHLFLGRDRAL